MEQEQLVNRLQRQLSQLLTTQQQQQAVQPNSTSLPSSPTLQDLPLDVSSHLGLSHRVSDASPIPGPNLAPLLSQNPAHPSAAVILDALQSENNNLRSKLANAECSVSQTSKVNEVYRQELIELRARAGLDIADLMNTNFSSSQEIYDSYANSSASHSRRGSNTRGNMSIGGIRIPGVSNSPPSHSRNVSKSSYSPSISSALSPSTLSSTSPATVVTTPSTSYTAPHAPTSTPTNYGASLPNSSFYSSMSSTPYGSTNSSGSAGPLMNYHVPPPSLASSVGQDHPASLPARIASPYGLSAGPFAGMESSDRPGSLQRRLSSSKHGARVAETGILKKRTNSTERGVASASTGDTVHIDKGET